MKTNFSLLFYLKKQKNYASGNLPIYMRITVEGNRAEIATNRDCDPKRWNAKGSRAIGSKEEIKVLNTHLDHLQNAIYYAHQFANIKAYHLYNLTNVFNQITCTNIATIRRF